MKRSFGKVHAVQHDLGAAQAADTHLPRKRIRMAKQTVTLQLEKDSVGKAATCTTDASPSTAGPGSQSERAANAAPSVKAGGPAKERKTGEGEHRSATMERADVQQQGRKRPKKHEKEQREAKGKPAHGVHDEPGAAAAAERATSRMASFAKPTLKKPNRASKGKVSRPKTLAGVADRAGAGLTAAAEQHLTKAQKKNLWRQKKRASLRDRPDQAV